MRILLTVPLVAGLLSVAPSAEAIPPEPRLFEVPPAEAGKDDWFVSLHPEYRVRLIRVDPLEVNGNVAETVSWGEQRLRLDASFGRRGIGAVHMQVDALDGVLFGDNGEFGSDPEPTTGVGLASRQVNLSGWTVGLRDGEDPLDPSSYGPVLRGIEPIEINYVYGEVFLPFGVVRIGRMPISDMGTVSLNDGRSGRNLWGQSYYHESVDRLLFGTKISEIIGLISEGPTYIVDKSLDDGVFFGFVYDYLVGDEIHVGEDNLEGMAFQLDFRSKRPTWLGEDWGPIRFTATGTFRWDDRFDTDIFALPMRLQLAYGDFSLVAELSYITGSSRELSAGFAELTGGLVTDQPIELITARVAPELEIADQLTLRLEWAYAKGDADPRTDSELSISSWPRDTNLGLMLFEHVVAFQSARAAAAGIQVLRDADAPSFPLTEIATDGRVTNVNALFPQVFWDVLPSLRLKAGVLLAWSDEPVIDPIQSLLNLDGVEIDDDLVNYNGGKPGSYWGTEVDLGIEFRYEQFFTAVLEAGVLFPGSALEDENGEAVNSWMLETRFVFTP